jgi:hypothetical protein
MLATRRAIAKEIEALQRQPRLVVQTSPPEGTVIPAGPRMVILRGITTPGAVITIDGNPVHNIDQAGCFTHFKFLADNQPTITITAERDGKTQTTDRTFRLAD